MTHRSTQPIGLFDSGLGGLTVLRELRKTLPNENFVYLGDTARTPYGSKSASTVLRYARECAGFLYQQEIKLLVVACNSASAVALDLLKEEASCPVLGTIESAVKSAIEVTTQGRIGIIGTDATIASGVYEKYLHQRNPSLELFSKACPLFVPLVEQGMLEGEIVEKTIEYYLQPLKDNQIDSLILACTHYPLLTSALVRFFGSQVTIVECSKVLAVDTKSLLSSSALLYPNDRADLPSENYFVTDEVSRFNYLGRLLLRSDTINAVKVDSL